jgi:regulator of sigma E protease
MGHYVDTVALVVAEGVRDNEQGGKDTVGIIGLEAHGWWQPVGFFKSVELAVVRSWEVGTLLVTYLWKLVTMQVSLKSVGGVVFIAKSSGEAAQMGIVPLLFLIAYLSVNLAVVNILPIPVLDGGHLVFLAIEVARRKPLTVRQRALVQQVGLAFLLMLIVMVTYNDITRIFFS